MESSGSLSTAEASRRVFRHHPSLASLVPELRAVALVMTWTAVVPVGKSQVVGHHLAQAQAALSGAQEGSWPAIESWRRVFARLGVRPTKHRCAAESLLRRLRTHGELPRIHPVVDVCNAVSAHYGVPIIAMDLDRVVGGLTVRRCSGSESWVGFDGSLVHPEPGEINYVDAAEHAHSLKWCHRQSARSAVHGRTSRALVVAEAVHERAEGDLVALLEDLRSGLAEVAPDGVIRDMWMAPGSELDLPTDGARVTEQEGTS